MDYKKIIEKSLMEATASETVHLESPENDEYGDYSTNVAMHIKGKKPQQNAQEIIEKLQSDKKLTNIAEKIEVAGPGFINFYLKEKFLENKLDEINKLKDDYGKSDAGKGKKVIVEYSSPNIAKRFSVGHFRSTIIGQALYNLFKCLGYEVIGENHYGDWGTQFGMIIAQVARKNLDPDSLNVEDYQKLYVEFNKEIEDNPDLREEAKVWFKKLEEGDSKAKEIWVSAVKTSKKEFQRIYDLLDIHIDNDHGESFYEDKMPATIKLLEELKLSRRSEGATIFEFDNMPPGMVLKSDGGTTYFTRDLAAIKYRIDTWNPDLIIYEVGQEQTLHFKQVFKAAEMIGWKKDLRLVHIGHGLFLFEGKKMSTRKGTDIKLEDVLQEAIDRATKLGDNKSNTKTAEIVGIGAIKYFELSHDPKSNIDFNWKSVLQLEGNSGPYLQYTYARTQSVLEKGQRKGEYDNQCEDTYYPEERSVMSALIKFPEIVEYAADTYSPNHLANYLYDLAQKYNNFYAKHKIIGSQKEEFRLKLTQATGIVLKNGLNLLGIEAPQKM